MSIEIKKYIEVEKNVIPIILEEAESFIKEDILECIRKNPNNSFVAYFNDRPAAVGVHLAQSGSKNCSFTLYVVPRFRRKGIGTKLLRELYTSMKNMGIERAITDYKVDETISAFIRARNITPWFLTNYMVYEGDKLQEKDLAFTTYEDKYYEEYYKLESNAFYMLRKANNIEPFIFESSEQDRKRCAEDAKDIFLLFEEDTLVAAGYAKAGEIDAIAVEKGFEGKGYGRALLCHGVNKLLDEGCSKVFLWVLEWNKKAKGLYENIGFRVERLHELAYIDLAHGWQL